MYQYEAILECQCRVIFDSTGAVQRHLSILYWALTSVIILYSSNIHAKLNKLQIFFC